MYVVSGNILYVYDGVTLNNTNRINIQAIKDINPQLNPHSIHVLTQQLGTTKIESLHSPFFEIRSSSLSLYDYPQNIFSDNYRNVYVHYTGNIFILNTSYRLVDVISLYKSPYYIYNIVKIIISAYDNNIYVTNYGGDIYKISKIYS